MSLSISVTRLVVAASATLALAGCLATGKSDSTASSGGTSTAAAAPAQPKIGPGMDARGNVTDPKKVEAGYGRTVKGLNDYEGEITGNPVAGSKFAQLQIGMPMKQVMDIVGTPTDQGAYVTGKAFIPFFFGGDRYRHELVYKGQGRLIFAGSSGFDTNAHLIWIIHSANEAGYR